MIRAACEGDLPVIVAMIERYRDEVRPDLEMHDASVTGTVTRLINHDRACVFLWVNDVPCGLIMGQAQPSAWWPELIAEPLIWWVEPHARGGGAALALVKCFEFWAGCRGCAKVGAVWTGKSADAFYARLGYRPGETRMLKDIA